MTYAYDDYVQMPTKDLYDTAVMKMAIEAAKDMYDKGQAQMENFYKTYGDFMSPFAKDMEWYGERMNNVRRTINDAYARGIDLFKSPEGRAIVAQLSHSIDPYRYNLARQNAKVGYEYLDAVKEAMRKGEYDEGFENFILNQEGGLGSFANFSSEGGRIWDRTAPSRFQDINQWTHHLFDNMELSYDPELSKIYPGYLAYSKNKDVMNTIAANNLATLAGTDLGKYMISRYEDQFKALGYSDSDATKKAVDMLQKNIVNSNWEQSQIKLEEDPYYAADYEHKLARELQQEKHEQEMEETYGPNWREDARKGILSYHGKGNGSGGSGNGGGNGASVQGYNTTEDVYATSLAKAAGIEYLPQGGIDPNELPKMLNAAKKRQKEAIASTGNVLQATGMFIDPQKITGLIQSDGEDKGGQFLNPNYIKNLYELDDIRTSYKDWRGKGLTKEESAEYRAKRKNLSENARSGIKNFLDTKNKKGGFRVKVVPVSDERDNNVYGMVGEDGRWHTYALVRVYMSDGKDVKNVNVEGGKKYNIPAEGRLMALEIGMRSNREKATPDLSVSAREEYGPYGYRSTKKEIGTTGNSGFMSGTNTLKHVYTAPLQQNNEEEEEK